MLDTEWEDGIKGMTDLTPPDATKTFGRRLFLRRQQLGYGHRQLRKFARERGAKVSVKTLTRLEDGERPTYSEETAEDVERLYALAAGSFWDSLKTGRLTVVDIEDPIWDDLRAKIMELPGLTDSERLSTAAHVRKLREERAQRAAERSAAKVRAPQPPPVLDDGVLAGLEALAASVTPEPQRHRAAS